jgi:hypothetical protein
MKTTDEQKADYGLKQLGIKPMVYHFRTGVAPFTAITLVDDVKSWITTKSILDDILSEIPSDAKGFYFLKTRYLKDMLHKNHIYGFAICGCDDYFNKRRGRTIAKGRLWKHLKEIEVKI